MEDTNDFFGKCPYFTVQKVFSEKWSKLIMHHLNDETLRYGELQRRIGEISILSILKVNRT
ncbi:MULTISPECIES: winged helix-turn-helix transcriptional regulator [Clostridium]|uniref:HTH hxlR-type domain-containing protein n=1 Tax=Clostridium beijerinckii TaxID=1520 RepID=A0A1S9N7X9_CLOBE|nr:MULTISPECIES: winged helix-turn-helix transcriptional regulator [Clostridium]OOP73677.1 hypothetical protein CBEIBR21_11685 [Clostridium beijerinckii]